MAKKRFNSGGEIEKILNCCPVCGYPISVAHLYQSSHIFRILKNGTESKVRKQIRNEGPMECYFIQCENDSCDFVTDCDLECENHRNLHIWEDNEGIFCYTDDFDSNEDKR